MLNTNWLGKKFIELDEIGSTNTFLKENGADFPDGTVVTAKRQTNGRGRMGNIWTSDTDMLSMSLLLKSLDNPINVTLMSAIAVCQAIENLYSIKASIKWTNDIIADNHKVCGILCESRINCAKQEVICGIGVNVNAHEEFFKTRNLPYASSLHMLSGKEITVKTVGDEILNKLEPLLQMDFTELKNEYKSRCITLGRTIRAIINSKEVTAKAIDIDDDGKLICENADGVFAINAGEVSVRGLYGYL